MGLAGYVMRFMCVGMHGEASLRVLEIFSLKMILSMAPTRLR
jgi:hypothetical protein